MEKYIKKPEIIKAEQFLLEKHHPLLGGTKPIHIPEGVLQHKGCGYRMCDICGGANSYESIYYVITQEGTQYVSNKDWIIKREDGTLHVCGNDYFIKNYDKVK